MTAAIENRIEVLLRSSATKAAIREQLGCSRELIDRVESERGLPPRRRGPRPRSDEELFEAQAKAGAQGHVYWAGRIRSDGVPMLRATSAYRVAWRLGSGDDPYGTVRPTCGISACVAYGHLSCRPPVRLTQVVTSMTRLVELIHARTEPVEPGSHVRWIGRTDVRGTPVLRYGPPRLRVETTAYRFVWLLATGAEPVGTVRPTCDMPHCVAPDHLTDAGSLPGTAGPGTETR